MTNAIGSTSQNVALQPAAARPADPGTEMVAREQQRENIDDREAVRLALASTSPADRKEKPGRVDRYV